MRKREKRIVKKIGLLFVIATLYGTVVFASEKNDANNNQNQQEIVDLSSQNVDNQGEIKEFNVESNEIQDELRIVNNKDNTYTIVFKKNAISDDIQKVEFPVWSKVNGQDDIKWYEAQLTEENIYTYTFELKDHKGLGNYYIHAYSVDSNGKKTFLKSTEYNIDEPEVKKIEVSEFDGNSLRVKVDGLNSNSAVKAVKIPVWSKANGQDDLVWYDAQKDEAGNYYADIDIKDHKYDIGKYNIHIYIDDVTGGRSFGGQVEKNIELKYEKFYVVSQNSKNYSIILSGLKVPDGTQVVKFPVWSKKNGQDDLKWYTATKNDEGNWQAEITIDAHKHLGEYYTHAYAVLPNGNDQFITNTTFTTQEPVANDVMTFVTDKKDGKIKVVISGIENDELIKKIEVPIWSEENQADLIWYTAEKQQDGTYVVETDISKHNYNCKLYNAHTYLTDIKGEKKFIKSSIIDLTPKCEKIEAKDVDGKEVNYKITVTNLEVSGGVQDVRFAVWGEEKGQNDLKWYTASKDETGNYNYTFKIRNHREFGKYQVHAYCTTVNGKLEYISETTCEVLQKVDVGMVDVSNINGTKGTFTVTVSGLMSPSGIEKVEIPMWCASDQRDLKWYTAMKTEDGKYQVTMNVLNHQYYFGNYNIHVYVTMGNGVRVFVTSKQADIEPQNYIYERYITSTTREVGILGATGNRVQFPTWSDAYGQDDIVWYEGIYRGAGKWNAVVNSDNHNSGGGYTTHVYVSGSTNSEYIGSMQYSLEKIPRGIYEMSIRANMYSSPTGYLALVNRSTHKVAIFQGSQGSWSCVKYWDCADGKASTPTVTGVFHVGSRGYYFDSGSARCYWWTQFYGNYLFHSVLYTHSGQLMDGRVGIALSHGCVRLKIENAKWIYDNIPRGTTVVVY